MLSALVIGVVHALLYAALTLGLGAWLIHEPVTGLRAHL